MREAARIERILEQKRTKWEKHPDVRLFQLLYKLQHDFAAQNKGAGRIEDKQKGAIGLDNYSLEDEQLEKFLKDWEF